MSDPHAPHAVAWLPDEQLQAHIERVVCLWAAKQLGETQWAQELRQASDPRQTKGRFAVLRDDPQRLALVVMLSGLRHHPEAWRCGVEAALEIWPEARRAVQDVARMSAAGAEGGGQPWRL
jgi:hypothetical protein